MMANALRLARIADLKGIFIHDIWNPNRWYWRKVTHQNHYFGVHALAANFLEGEVNGNTKFFRSKDFDLPTNSSNLMEAIVILSSFTMHLDLLDPHVFAVEESWNISYTLAIEEINATFLPYKDFVKVCIFKTVMRFCSNRVY